MMLAIEERLFDEYKMVDNICRDMLSSQSGIKQYIMEMEQNSSCGRSVVTSWDRDYRWLKRVHGLRNQIAHEASATDCNEEDLVWLEEFHNRLLERRDPLALLVKANREQSNFSSRHENTFGGQLSSIDKVQLSLIDEVQLGSLPQRENVSKTGAEQRVIRNADLQNKKDSSNWAVVGLVVLIAVLIMLAALAALIIYH